MTKSAACAPRSASSEAPWSLREHAAIIADFGGSAVEHPRARPARVIAIDGPAASGKSAVGTAVASALGYRFVDTGAMYRAMTWLALERGVDVRDPAALADLAASTDVQVRAGNGATQVIVDGEDATSYLREPDVEANVSLVSRVPAVRSVLVKKQRELAAEGRMIMAGRDIGSVVLPNADLKIYLDASPRVRAERRAREQNERPDEREIERLAADIVRRDTIDSTRETSPLTATRDAEIINTDAMNIDDVVARILELVT